MILPLVEWIGLMGQLIIPIIINWPKYIAKYPFTSDIFLFIIQGLFVVIMTAISMG